MLSKPTYPITFLRTNNLQETKAFYEEIMRFPIALVQSGCIVFRVGNYGYWGFCETDKEISKPEQVCLTVVVEKREDVDKWNNHLLSHNIRLIRTPQETSQYKIYNGFYLDPNGYSLEIQAFDEDGKPNGHDDFSKNCGCGCK